MQRRLAEELRALRFDDKALLSRRGGFNYSTSIQRVVAVSAAATSAALVFPSSCGSSSASSTSVSSSNGSAVATPSSGAESYKLLRMEAFRDISAIASHMVNDGYTEGLITEFSRRQRCCSGGDAILRTWFSELGVDWVLGVDESKLQEEPWSAVEDLIKRWVVAFAVMAEALRLTSPGLCSDDGSGSGVGTLATKVIRSAPPGAAPTTSSMLSPVSSGSSDVDQESSDPARNRSIDVATVKEAIIAYSAAEKGRLFSFGGYKGAGPQNQFVLFAEASLMKMLRFPEAVSDLRRSPEKILRMIDMYAVVSDACPGLLALLSGGSKDLVSDRIGSVLKAMSDAVMQILHNLTERIQAGDSWKIQSGNDDIHPVNQYVLNYINLLLENRTVLDSILMAAEDHESILFAAENPSLTSTVMDLISVLDAMLEVKSNEYAAPAGRRYIFLLNNAYFILQQAEPALQSFLGTSSWSVYRNPQIDRYIKGYLDASWGPVTARLAVKQRRNSVFRKVSALVEFNALLQVTYNTEKFWKINSPQLRSTLRELVSNKVMPAYRAYLKTDALNVTSATYTPEELEGLFQELFEG